ncbi:MAG: iron-sulfur cluster insertion protein ErpA [Pelagibacterales bacterium]|nr:iron-sulfur cluster insertion protein ErpA [Pelagibacterales bacterium]
MTINLTNSAIERIKEIRQKESNHNKFLRLSVTGGGCGGFQYIFDLDNQIQEDDIKIYEENSEVLALTDNTSLQLLDGCQVEFIKELGASYFKVNNPNATSSCGCGSSFSI